MPVQSDRAALEKRDLPPAAARLLYLVLCSIISPRNNEIRHSSQPPVITLITK